jgi:hypothetical protein
LVVQKYTPYDAYIPFGFAIASIFEYETRGAYVELLGQWGMLVMSFYFGGRTMEKIADRIKK